MAHPCGRCASPIVGSETNSTRKEMPVPRNSRLLFFLFAIVFVLSAIALTVSNPTPALAQDETEPMPCLSRDECRELRQEVRKYKQELRPMRRELRELRKQIRETSEGEERDRLVAQAREHHRELKQLRRETKPTVRQFKGGCRPACFGDRA